MADAAEVKYYQITLADINPYFGRELQATVYLLGSPGSGKTRFLSRLKEETGGTLVIESGVFALFQKHAIDYVNRKREKGITGEIRDFFIIDDDPGYKLDQDFRFPNIDGFCITNCQRSCVPLDKTLDESVKENRELWGQDDIYRNLPYSGYGATQYREGLSKRIKSGGKSGFPDWLFIPISDDKYAQVICFPGHHRISFFKENKSIPSTPLPDSVIYLVDSNIDQFDRIDRTGLGWNAVIEKVGMHLKDALELEGERIPVKWYLSKTKNSELNEKRKKAHDFYNRYEMEIRTSLQHSRDRLEYAKLMQNKQDLSEIIRRVWGLRGIDSFESSKEEILAVLAAALNN